jgi:hypothetical protein
VRRGEKNETAYTRDARRLEQIDRAHHVRSADEIGVIALQHGARKSACVNNGIDPALAQDAIDLVNVGEVAAHEVHAGGRRAGGARSKAVVSHSSSALASTIGYPRKPMAPVTSTRRMIADPLKENR